MFLRNLGATLTAILLCAPAAGGADADPPAGPGSAIAADPGFDPAVAALRAAVLPAPTGDGFFDDWPAGLDRYRDGQVITARDITAASVTSPLRQIVQLKFRTTDAHGMPSFGTATLLVPAATWTGPGDRPLLVNNQQIDSLGRKCAPGYNFAAGLVTATDLTTLTALGQGYAVLVPDHEGPRMAYAEPTVAGHIVLDAIRAARDRLPRQFAHSRVALWGYSGGAIAALGAARLMDSYAPELASALVGAAIGGVPADYPLLSHTMNGNLASGLYLAATLGLAREHPEMLTALNGIGRWAATSPLKDQCNSILEAEGLAQLPVELATDLADPLQSPLARRIYAETSLAGRKSGVPLYIYNGEQEWWVPASAARAVFREQCALGVRAVYRPVPGEHFIASFLGYSDSVAWLDQRLAGEPAPAEC